jgi:hypothetical protein
VDAHQRRVLKRAINKAEADTNARKEPAPPPAIKPEKTPLTKLLEFFEHGWVIGALCTVGSLVGFFYKPVLAVCGIAILLAFHRVGVVRGKRLRIQLAAYSVLFVTITSLLMWTSRIINKNLPHLPTATENADAVVAKLGKASRPQEVPTPLEVPTSVLVMTARMGAVYGPTVPWTQVDFDITNPPEESIRNLELKIGRVSKLYIRSMSDPYERTDCKAEPVNTFPERRVLFRGKDPNSFLAIDSEPTTQLHMQNFGSIQWSLFCLNVSGQKRLRFHLDVQGDAENDSLLVSGKYELMPSKGSAVVRVKKQISVMK